MAGMCSMNVYVSPLGRDTWPGRFSAPNRTRTDGPFGTLERARDAIRKIKATAGLPKGGVTVWVRSGTYELTRTFGLDAEDSGSAQAPVVYRGYGRERVRITGGRRVTDFRPVSDPAILARLDPVARDHVLQTDLKAQGITDYGDLSARGFGRPIQPSGLELFFNDRPMPLARWPNSGWATIAAVPDGPQGNKFTYEGDRPARWKDDDDIWVHGYWTWNWADSYEKVASIDPGKHEITTVPPGGVYGYTPGRRFYALNILEELDEPGEWYLDRKTGILYFWPPSSIEKGRAVVSTLSDPLVTMQGAHYITLRGMTLECGRAGGVVVEGGDHVRIAGCVIRNLGDAGVSIGAGGDALQGDGSSYNGVTGCDIYNTGEGGIILGGGNRLTLTSAHNYAENNDIHNYQRWVRTYRPGVSVQGVGNIVSHNAVHDAPHSAIILGGNNHTIEYNDIYRVCRETGDAGAFYMGRDWTQRGNVVRYNYFHDLSGVTGQEGFSDVMAIYLDDWTSGTRVYGNLCVRAGRAVLIGGGRDNWVENNIFVDCHPAVHVDARGLGWGKSYFDGKDSTLFDRLAAVNGTHPPYSAHYPDLADLLHDDPAFPKGNHIRHNICVGGKWLELLDGLTEQEAGARDNWVGGDPGFVDAAPGDLRLKADSPLLKQGFRQIPVGKIGLVQDEYRAELPPGDCGTGWN